MVNIFSVQSLPTTLRITVKIDTESPNAAFHIGLNASDIFSYSSFKTGIAEKIL